MKTLKWITIAGMAYIFSSCEIAQETNIRQDGSGIYSLSFDLSEMIKMNGTPGQMGFFCRDTLIEFAYYLEEKKDSISKLSKEQQEEMGKLKNYSMQLTADTLTHTFKMKINFKFKKTEDISEFGTYLKSQNIRELDLFLKAIPSTGNESKNILELNKSFNTSFNSKSFSFKITDEAFQMADAKKKPNLKKDAPDANFLRIKIRYNFPYKIKNISNSNATLTSDSKGFEIAGNAYDLNHNPRHLDTEITFE
jgi:hypothetical protein